MNILLMVNDMVWPNRGGGAPRVDAVAKAFKRAGHNIAMFAPIGTTRSEAEQALGYEVMPMKYVDRNDPKKIMKYAISNPSLILKTMGIMKRKNVDVVFAHNSICGFPALIAAKFLNRKMVFDPTDFQAEFIADSVGRKGLKKHFFKAVGKAEAWVIKNADKVITNTKTIAGMLENKYGRKVEVVYDCVNFEIFHPIKTKKGNDFTYIIQGGMDPQDGLEILVPAAKQVKEKTRFKIMLVGDGKVVPSLKQKINQEQLNDHFKFTGWVTQKEVNELTAKSDVGLAILPNKLSGRTRLTLRALEYWACGKPIIAANLDAIREVVKHGENGLLYEPENPNSLAQQMIKISKDKKLYSKLAKNGYKSVQEFDSKKLGDKIVNIILGR